MIPVPHVLGLAAALALAAAPCAAQTAPSPAGRLLASNCFQCHGTDGRDGAFERLAGESAAEILEELREMRSESVGNDIMKRHARGYTDAQLKLIADYLSRQPR